MLFLTPNQQCQSTESNQAVPDKGPLNSCLCYGCNSYEGTIGHSGNQAASACGQWTSSATLAADTHVTVRQGIGALQQKQRVGCLLLETTRAFSHSKVPLAEKAFGCPYTACFPGHTQVFMPNGISIGSSTSAALLPGVTTTQYRQTVWCSNGPQQKSYLRH